MSTAFKILARLTLVPMLASAAALTHPRVASACDPGRTSDFVPPPNGPVPHFDGWYRSANWHAVEADIEEGDPFMYQDNNVANDTTAWVMLDECITYYAQVGWVKDNSKARHVFWEWKAPQSANKLLWSPQPQGNFSHYEVEHVGDQNEFKFIWPGNSSTQAIDFAPDTAENFAELHDKADQEPGTPGDHIGFQNVHVLNSLGDVINFNGTKQGQYPAWMGGKVASTAHFEVWDLDC